MNIEEINIGDKFLGTKMDKKFINEYADSEVTVMDKTSNSIEVYILARTKDGANCRQWFTMNDFNHKFIKI